MGARVVGLFEGETVGIAVGDSVGVVDGVAVGRKEIDGCEVG